MRKISALLASLLCIWILMPCLIHADTLRNSLLLHYYAINEAMPLADATFYLYRVAEPDAQGGYALTEEFTKYQVDISKLDWNEAGRLTELAITLSAYALRDRVPDLETGITDVNGNLMFHDLEDGLYLISGNVLDINVDGRECSFVPQPLLLPLPYPDSDGTVISDMEVDVKYNRFFTSSITDQVDLTARKVWIGGENHPDSIIVQLMRNGIVVETVELNEDNQWQYTWEGMESGYGWMALEEEIPKDYTVSIHQEDEVFTITNTRTSTKGAQDIPSTTESTFEASDPPSHDTTDVPSVTENDDPTESTAEEPPYTGNSTDTTEPLSGTSTNTSGNSPSLSKLPQTGQLWWPVPLLAGTGMLMIGTGMILQRNDK